MASPDPQAGSRLTVLLAVLAGVLLLLTNLLPSQPDWVVGQPRAFGSFYPDELAWLSCAYVIALLAVLVPASALRHRRHLGPVATPTALPAIVIPAVTWLVLAAGEPPGSGAKSWGNLLEMPVLGILVGIALVIGGRRLTDWYSSMVGAWIGSAATLGAWLLVPSLKV